MFYKKSPHLNHAVELYQKGSIKEAFDQYGRALFSDQNPSYLVIAKEWLSDPELSLKIDEETICTLIARITSFIDYLEPEDERNFLQTLCLNVLRGLEEKRCVPRQDTTDRYVAESVLLRHMSDPKEAKKAALIGLEKHHTAYCAIFAALSCLDLEEEEEADHYLKIGLQLDPANRAGCNDLGDYYFDRRRYDTAQIYYKLALEGNDSYNWNWAEPSFLFCEFINSNDPLMLERLAACAAQDIENKRSSYLCDLARFELLTPYVDYIPPSSEASIHYLRSARREGYRIEGSRMALSCQEAASCINAIRLFASDYNEQDASFFIIVNHVPDPPLSSVIIPEGIVLWDYDCQNDAHPALPKPTKRAASKITALTRTPFSLLEWYKRASELVSDLDEEDVSSLYSCMIYPPRPEQDIPVEEWLMLVDYAAVCLLAQLGKTYIKAESTQMKHYLETLPSPELARICLGQLDWPIIPALTLLSLQAKEKIADRNVVDEILGILFERMPKKDYCFYEHALICAFNWFPGYEEEFYQGMRKRRRQLEEF